MQSITPKGEVILLIIGDLGAAGRRAYKPLVNMAHILFLYSTVDGHTLEICRRLQRVVTSRGHEASLVELTPTTAVNLGQFDRIVIGASIRYGKHRPEVKGFIDRNIEMLESKPSAFFSVNAVARKPEKRLPHTNPYVRKFLKRISWRPAVSAVFGGKIDYPKYGFSDKMIIRFIMWMTKGPTDPNATVDFTDWDQVDSFGRAIADI
jgi:menaquinone-dependent protoporphyrinogen oxidase